MGRRHSLLVALALVVGLPAVTNAGKVTLRNGTVLEGELGRVEDLTVQPPKRDPDAITVTPFLRVEAGYKLYYLHDKQRQEIDPGQSLSAFDVFELKQPTSRKSLQVGSVGMPLSATPFDEHGRRTVTYAATDPVIQGVTKIAPKFVTVEGISFSWWQGYATQMIPRDQLSAMLHAAIDRNDPDDRMSIARFYVQAGLYEEAAAELKVIATDFSFMAAKVEELDRDLRQLRANDLLAEIRKRQAAGQHGLALIAAEAFPRDLDFDADVLRQVDALRDEYQTARENGDEALVLLGELEAQLDDPEQRQSAAAARAVIREQLNWETLGRLEAFLKLADDESLSASERLALAYSGWVVGSAQASTQLTTALSLWRARSLVSEYLREKDRVRRGEILNELEALEGVSTRDVANAIPFLPPWIESKPVAPLTVEVFETAEPVRGWNADPDDESILPVNSSAPIRYAVALPPEYVPTRDYPLLVALRPSEWTIEQTAEFWGVGRFGGGGPATQAGSIVVAPEYASLKQGDYGYAVHQHDAILAAICDAKKRFSIDSNRVFLAGHGMGADATFDVACAHPDLFAGAAPISGLCRPPVGECRQNAVLVPFYVVNGLFDRSAGEQNATDLSWMMKHGHDVLWCQYVGRGYEYYQEELPAVLEWMGRLRRASDPATIDAQVVRTSEDRFYWLTIDEFPRDFRPAFASVPQARAVRPMVVEARISQTNTITVPTASGRYVLRLNESLIDLDVPVKVRARGRQVMSEFLEPETEALLDEVARTGDRQRLYPVRLVVE